jgi:hypothetical protein
MFVGNWDIDRVLIRITKARDRSERELDVCDAGHTREIVSSWRRWAIARECSRRRRTIVDWLRTVLQSSWRRCFRRIHANFDANEHRHGDLDRDCHSDRDGHVDTDGYGNSDSYPNSDDERHSNRDINRDADPDRDRNCNFDIHCHSYQHADSDCYGHLDADGNVNSDSYPNGDEKRHSNRNINQDRNSNCDRHLITNCNSDTYFDAISHDHSERDRHIHQDCNTYIDAHSRPRADNRTRQWSDSIGDGKYRGGEGHRSGLG